jgi:hypothetical protein
VRESSPVARALSPEKSPTKRAIWLIKKKK